MRVWWMDRREEKQETLVYITKVEADTYLLRYSTFRDLESALNANIEEQPRVVLHLAILHPIKQIFIHVTLLRQGPASPRWHKWRTKPTVSNYPRHEGAGLSR